MKIFPVLPTFFHVIWAKLGTENVRKMRRMLRSVMING